MVSIPCNYTSLPTSLPKLPFSFTPKPNNSHAKLHFHPVANTLNFNSSNSQPNNHHQQQLRTLFPGGFKRPEIKIPTLIIRISADQVLCQKGEDGSVVDEMVAKGFVGIVVVESEEGGGGSGGRLYEAACAVKSLVGDRAYLLVSERVDIAAAVGASGVLLSDQGLPTLVARNMMMKSKSDAIYLPLVARMYQSTNSANTSSSEG